MTLHAPAPEPDASRARVLGIVVAFHPQPEALLPLLQALAPQVEALLIVDNTPGTGEGIEGILSPLWTSLPGLRLERTGDNIGIAAAQNIGIRIALEENYDFVLLSDQDSLPDESLVATLRNCCEQLEKQGPVGCVCPEYFDKTTGQAFPFQVQRPGRWFYGSAPGTEARPWIEIITAISSGSLIPRAAFEVVGPMREDFFIDHVDIEWCHRARALGFHNFGTAQTRLTHHLGDAPFRVWYFGWHRHSEYSPMRLYYRFRNFVLLCRLPHVPLSWAMRASRYWLADAYAHCVFARQRWASARAIALALWDGVLGRGGPLRRSI